MFKYLYQLLFNITNLKSEQIYIFITVYKYFVIKSTIIESTII